MPFADRDEQRAYQAAWKLRKNARLKRAQKCIGCGRARPTGFSRCARCRRKRKQAPSVKRWRATLCTLRREKREIPSLGTEFVSKPATEPPKRRR